MILSGQEFRLRSSVGAGLLWQSPLGPIRFDYAVATSKGPFDVTSASALRAAPASDAFDNGGIASYSAVVAFVAGDFGRAPRAVQIAGDSLEDIIGWIFHAFEHAVG